jgi:SAM-dependent methyltransferase
VNYGAWADFVEQCFEKFLPQKPELVLDLACGTGSMTIPLANRGYDMIGVDGSAEMLAEAFARAEGRSDILWLLQDMRSFELYGTVGAVTCCLDSLNYLLDDGDLQKCFATVHNYLDPNGLFLFDMNTPYKFEHTYGNNAYVLEDEIVWEDGERSAIYCGWQNTYHPETGLCDFDLSLFEEDTDGRYRRSDEHQVEKCYELETVKTLLAQAGFELLGVWGGFDFQEPRSDCERWYIAARAIKK